MMWSWLSFMVGIGVAGLVCVVVGLVLTLWRRTIEASE